VCWAGLSGGSAVVRRSRVGWPIRAAPSSVRLFTAAGASFATAVLLAVLTDPWQELMSVPGATPIMVIKDVTSTVAPFAAALLVPWLVLAPRRRHGAPTLRGEEAA